MERNLFLLAIHDPSVIGIQHQPRTIVYRDKNGKVRRYTPDAYLEFKNGSKLLIEVKHVVDVENDFNKFEERWKAAKQWSEQNGMEFHVFTEVEINTPRYANIWFTLGASKCHDNDKFIGSLKAIMITEGVEYNYLCHKLANSLGLEITKAGQIICYAIYHGLVFVDTFSTREISKNTLVRKNIGGESSPFRSIRDEMTSLRTGELDDLLKPRENEVEETIYLKELSQDATCGKKYNEMVEYREEMVIEWLNYPKENRSLQWRDDFYKKWGFSRSQFYRILRRYKEGGKNALYPNYSNSGRKNKYSGVVQDLIEQARKYYLKPGVTIKKAHEKLHQSCKKAGIETPKESSLKWYIYKNTTAFDRSLKKGKRFQKTFFTPSLKSFQGGILPMQVVQMDNTPFDVFPVDEEERRTMSTPSMTAAKDAYTGMITGFTVSHFKSDSRTVLEVLVQTILPKSGYTRAYESEQDWPIQGFPVAILVDNGLDYRSKALKRFCKKYDIIIEYAPVKTPQHKAYIETWFHVLKNAMKQESIPGLRPTLKERIDNPDLKPEKGAILTLQEIETWVHKWVIDDYHFKNQFDDHVLAPFLRYHDAMEGKTDLVLPRPREPPARAQDIDELHLSTLKRDKRLLSRVVKDIRV